MLPALRAQIAEILSPAKQPPGLPTGVRVLDALLPWGGLPIGRLTEIVSPRGGGRATALRAIVRTTVQRDGWVAVIDASRTLSAHDWTARSVGMGTSRSPATGHPPPFLFIRPRRAERAAWCADLLLRTGAFALVVIDGAPPLSRQVAARLTRLARDAGAALIVAAEVHQGGGGATQLPGALRLRVGRQWPAASGRWREKHPRIRNPEHRTPNTRTRTYLTIRIEKGGPRRSVEVSYAVPMARRMCAHPQIPDRRGVAKSTGFGIRESGSGKSPEPDTAHAAVTGGPHRRPDSGFGPSRASSSRQQVGVG